MAKYEFSCFRCQARLEFEDRVGRREECPSCGADVHVCRNCLNYDPKVYNECREPQADIVRERDRANYCEYFSPHGAGSRGAAAGDTRESLLDAAEALFKKK